MTPAYLRLLLHLLNRRQKLWLGLLLIAVLATAVLEMASVAAVLPFLTVAADPNRIDSNAWLAWAYDILGFTDHGSFLVALGLVAFVIVVVSNAGLALAYWGQQRFVRNLTHQLGVRLLRQYAAQPYVFFLRRNSADLGKNVLIEVEAVTKEVVMPALRLVARAVMVIALLGLLIAFDPLLAAFMALILGGAYAGIFVAVRRRLLRMGRQRLKANTGRSKALYELLGAIKDVKLLGREATFLADFATHSATFARTRATASLISQLPRYALEAIAFGGILLIAVYLMARGGSLAAIVPTLGLYAFAGYRLMPALQELFNGITTLRFATATLQNFQGELEVTASRPAPTRPASTAPAGPASAHMPFRSALELDHVTFAYPEAPRAALHDITLRIPAGSTVGIIGPSGAGKTTLIDIILGLLRPDSGEIRVDGMPLTDANLRQWQNTIGYVPQHIYLADDTIARNIALGVPEAEINMASVRRAACLAEISSFVATELPNGYGTLVGERGVRLSGGQRQRIGIARALYRDPKVVILDEATSALDDSTQEVVMDAIASLHGTRTLIVIAHRTTTIATADYVYKVEHGSIQPAIVPVRSTHPTGSGCLR